MRSVTMAFQTRSLARPLLVIARWAIAAERIRLERLISLDWDPKLSMQLDSLIEAEQLLLEENNTW